jgi:hypothetical protein
LKSKFRKVKEIIYFPFSHFGLFSAKKSAGRPAPFCLRSCAAASGPCFNVPAKAAVAAQQALARFLFLSLGLHC